MDAKRFHLLCFHVKQSLQRMKQARLLSLVFCSSSNGENRTESDVLCETTIVGYAGRGEELALEPRSALIGSNMARLSASPKIYTLAVCVVQMML